MAVGEATLALDQGFHDDLGHPYALSKVALQATWAAAVPWHPTSVFSWFIPSDLGARLVEHVAHPAWARPSARGHAVALLDGLLCCPVPLLRIGHHRHRCPWRMSYGEKGTLALGTYLALLLSNGLPCGVQSPV